MPISEAASNSNGIFVFIIRIYSTANDLRNLRGQSPTPKPDATNPRQVDAVDRHFVFLNQIIERVSSQMLDKFFHKYMQLVFRSN